MSALGFGLCLDACRAVPLALPTLAWSLAAGLLTLAPMSARAETVTIDLTSIDYYDAENSTGLWNPVAGRIQAPVFAAGTELDFGDGSDGEFNNGPAQTGITVNSSTSITINTDEKDEFNFTSFNLGSGVVLDVTGSKPLTIRVLGATTIAGTISANGAAASANNVDTLGAAGVAGGGDGGDGGGTANTDHTNRAGSGTSKNAMAVGGEGGVNLLLGGSPGDNQGGGGGCFGYVGGGDVATPGSDGAATAGTANTGAAGDCSASTWQNVADGFESHFDSLTAGGAGGGGGGSNESAARTPGAGGGGGAGGIRIVSLGSVTLSGAVEAIGGDGGANLADDSAGACGGAGGGGAGGALWIQSPVGITGGGILNVSGGAGGANAACSAGANSGRGGNGSRGAIRIDGTNGFTGTYTPAAAVDRNHPTAVTPGTYAVVSKPVDLTDGYFTISNVQKTVGCTDADGSLALAFEGSNDGVTFDKSVAETEVAELANYPYVRFKVEITATGADPDCLTALSFEKTHSNLKNLRVSGGLVCGFASRGGAGPLSLLGDLAVLLISGMAALRLRRA